MDDKTKKMGIGVSLFVSYASMCRKTSAALSAVCTVRFGRQRNTVNGFAFPAACLGHCDFIIASGVWY